MAAAHLAANEDLPGIFCIDATSRAYHGRSHLPKAHLARARLAMPAPSTPGSPTQGRRGDGLAGAPGATLSAELARAMTEIRSLVGPDARPTLVFDRGGCPQRSSPRSSRPGSTSSPTGKARPSPSPGPPFVAYDHVDDLGHAHTYHLADRTVRLAYSRAKPAAASPCAR